jgi:hypothetical protein
MRYEIPTGLPAFVETDDGALTGRDEATAVQWREHKKRTLYLADRRVVSQLLKTAAAANISDDVPLLPRLRALAADNVVSLPRRPH